LERGGTNKDHNREEEEVEGRGERQAKWEVAEGY